MVYLRMAFFRMGTVICTALLFLLVVFPVFNAELSSILPVSENSSNFRFPTIKSLTYSDAVFKQFSQEVSDNYLLLAKNENPIPSIYTYFPTGNDTLLAIAARCNIPYESIATLNNIAFIDSPLIEKELFLPTFAGLFIAEKPQTPLEFLLKTRYSISSTNMEFQLASFSFSYVPSAKLSPTERAFFTDSSMIPPLEVGIISSSFGMRISPFTGEQTFHQGTDIAAAIGTSVFATKSGIVSYSGWDNIYGNYIILQHDNNTQSLYAHLDEFFVFAGEVIEKGAIIGTVGNTGLSTGPHLHFEIRIGRKAQDPSSLIKNFWQ